MEEWKLGRWKGETMERDNGSNGKEKQWKGDSGSMEVEKDWVTRNGHWAMEAKNSTNIVCDAEPLNFTKEVTHKYLNVGSS